MWSCHGVHSVATGQRRSERHCSPHRESTCIDVLLNSGGWVFPDAEHRYTLVLVAAALGGGDKTISVSSVADSRGSFDHIDEDRVEWRLEDLRQAIPDLAVPLLPSHRMATIFQRLSTSHPRFDSGQGRVACLAVGRIRRDQRPEVGPAQEPGRYEGEWRGQSTAAARSTCGSRRLWKAGRMDCSSCSNPRQDRRLQAEAPRVHRYGRRIPQSVHPRPWNTAHVAAHGSSSAKIARATDSRTVVAALPLPTSLRTTRLPSLVWPAGDDADVAYLLGVMSSVPFDWLARRRVEVNLNYFILNSLAVPRPPRTDARWQRTRGLGRTARIHR